MLLAKHGGGVGIGINQIRPVEVLLLLVMEHQMELYHSLKYTILQSLLPIKVQLEEEAISCKLEHRTR